MVIVGIHSGHDSSVTVLKDGKNIFSMGEERISRKKNHIGIPRQALSYIFENRIIKPNDVTVVASTSSVNKDHDLTQSFKNKEQEIIDVFKALGCDNFQVRIYDHHLAHGASAYYGSGFENALLVTSDGGGDGLSGAIYTGKKGELETLYTASEKDSVGMLYTGVTSHLGFKPSRHEGKITGLAAYGQGDGFYHFLKTVLHHENGHLKLLRKHPNIKMKLKNTLVNFLRLNPIRFGRFMVYAWHKVWIKNHHFPEKNQYYFFDKNHTPEDFAAGIQRFSEDVLCDWIEYWVKETGLKKVALAGGVFANVKINQRITERCGVDDIFIYPNMGDGGLSYGVAILEHYQNHPYKPKTSITDTMYLGPDYTDDDILHSINNADDLEYEKSKDIAHDVADLIANRTIVGWFQGRMEFGPRALGARSVVAMADDATINDWLNQRMQRTEFMPFAPSVLAEHMDDIFVIDKKDFKRAAEYMTITYDVKEKWAGRIAAVNHVDNTARPQMVSLKTNPLYYKMLSHVYKKTGIPLTINTSFNVHEEPIVMSPQDAFSALRRGMVDVVAIGSYLVRTKGKS